MQESGCRPRRLCVCVCVCVSPPPHDNLAALQPHIHTVPSCSPRGHRANNLGAIKRRPLIPYFLKRSAAAANAKVAAASAGSRPSSLFICGLPISCQTQTHLVALTGQTNPHTHTHTRGFRAGERHRGPHTLTDFSLNINFNYRAELSLIKLVFTS